MSPTMTIETTPTTATNDENRSNCKSPRPVIEIRILGVENTNYKIQRLPGKFNLAVPVIPDEQSTNQPVFPPNNLEPTNAQNPPPENVYIFDGTTLMDENEDDEEEIEEDRENLISQLSMITQLADGSYSCNICSHKEVKAIVDDKTLIFRHLLRAHSRSHNFECPSCPKSFPEEEELDEHIYVAHSKECKDGDKFYGCTRCKHESSSESLLNLHVLRKHASVYKYVCNCCAKCFKTWSGKQKHEKIIGVDKVQPKNINFMCSKCTKVLNTKDELSLHLFDAHSEVLNFSTNSMVLINTCKYCTTSFSSKKGLREHLADRGTECFKKKKFEKRGCFICSTCDKQFANKEFLRKHHLVHTGERVHACPECGRTFAQKSTMRLHILTHGGIKPYVCTVCNMGYAQRSVLMRHWKNKHKDLPPPPPVDIHHFFDEDERLMVSNV